MALRRFPEQALIERFLEHMRDCADEHVAFGQLINSDCRAKALADVEYKSKDGTHWVVEAKSDDSADKHNTVHKIFGELLKETGRANRQDVRYGILIPRSSVQFYSRAFQRIARDKFLGFGSLIPVRRVFLCCEQHVSWITWEDLYDAYQAEKPVDPNTDSQAIRPSELRSSLATLSDQ